MFKNVNNTSSIDSYLDRLQDLEITLKNLQYFIKTTVSKTPLELVYQIINELQDMKKEITASTETKHIILLDLIKKHLLTLQGYKKFLLSHQDHANRIAEELEKKHSLSILNWKNDFYNLQHNNYYKSTFNSNNLFDHSLICYIKIWEILYPTTIENHKNFAKYKDNSLAQLFLNDIEFIRALKGSQFFSGGTIGHCIIQKLLFMNLYVPYFSKTILNTLMPGGICHSIFEKDFFNYNQEIFKAEIIKLVLYKNLALANGIQPIAWIGSTNTLTKMLEYSNDNTLAFEKNGIYLNCGDYLTPEFNRAWLLALIEMNYEIKLVERQFPNIERAILSNNSIDFLLLLANEIRKIDEHNNPAISHSQYHGGDSPTATSLEILLLMSMNCKATKDYNEGTISLSKSKTPNVFEDINYRTSTCKPITLQYTLKRSHSFTSIASMQYKTINQLITCKEKTKNHNKQHSANTLYS